MKISLKSLVAICLFCISSVSAASLNDPVVLFSDLISAPKSGWSSSAPSKGAVVTVWGKNFGIIRGSSFVSVNGVDLINDSDYLDDWGKTNSPTPFLQSLTFQLNDSMSSGNGTISVVVDGVRSNEIPFRINGSKIYFIDNNNSGSGSGTIFDPWSSPASFVDAMQPGDIGYFRAGTFDGRTTGGKHVIWVRDTDTSGTAADPIGFVAYPGEDVHLDGITNGSTSSFNRGIGVAKYTTVAKFRISAIGGAVEMGDYIRVIGNDTIGVQELVGGTGIITAVGNAPIIYGNTVHGGRSGNRLDHSIYISGCQDEAGGAVGYNFSYDNVIDRGPHFVDNHQGDRCASNVFMKSNHWHHNVISCEGSPSRGLGIYDLSWDSGDANQPEPAYVYNNIIVGCGQDSFGAIYHNNGHALFYNNSLINNEGPGFTVAGSQVLSSSIVNNLISHSPGNGEECIEVNSDADAVTNVDSNAYSGCSIYSGDVNGISGDPKIELNLLSSSPIILDSSSPLVDAGSSVVSSIVTDDFDSVERVGGYDIGANEYFVRPNPPLGISVQ